MSTGIRIQYICIIVTTYQRRDRTLDTSPLIAQQSGLIFNSFKLKFKTIIISYIIDNQQSIIVHLIFFTKIQHLTQPIAIGGMNLNGDAITARHRLRGRPVYATRIRTDNGDLIGTGRAENFKVAIFRQSREIEEERIIAP